MPHNFLSRLTGSFAMPAAENPTVAMAEAAYRHHGLDIRYINCEVPPEKPCGRRQRRPGHGLDWVQLLDPAQGRGDPTSRRPRGFGRCYRAVNCAVRRGEKFIGENTDGKGFLQSLREVVDPAGKQIVMFGAGGAARAIGVELALAGAKRITVVNRSEDRGRTLVDLLNSRTRTPAELVIQRNPYQIPAAAEILVNATSIGLYPDVDGRLDLDVESLRPSLVVADVIPNPPRTMLVREAERRGCRVLDGLGMIVNQGVIGIRYWTGVDVDASVMRKTLEDLFSN